MKIISFFPTFCIADLLFTELHKFNKHQLRNKSSFRPKSTSLLVYPFVSVQNEFEEFKTRTASGFKMSVSKIFNLDLSERHREGHHFDFVFALKRIK